ncbi:hypothetical protein DXA95_07515 [Odoribacter sp. OF09-27XD]|jgi:hypothetical protein|nr:hypothetical protein DXA95_07515 [Odoribacter sp. OF09-27XD]HBO26918.1 hypothetical protein [Culturomica sp.]
MFMLFTNKIILIQKIKGSQKSESICGISETCGPNPKSQINNYFRQHFIQNYMYRKIYIKYFVILIYFLIYLEKL